MLCWAWGKFRSGLWPTEHVGMGTKLVWRTKQFIESLLKGPGKRGKEAGVKQRNCNQKAAMMEEVC